MTPSPKTRAGSVRRRRRGSRNRARRSRRLRLQILDLAPAHPGNRMLAPPVQQMTPIVNKPCCAGLVRERCSRVAEALVDLSVLVLVAEAEDEPRRAGHFSRRAPAPRWRLGRRRKAVGGDVQRALSSPRPRPSQVLLSREPTLHEHVERYLADAESREASTFTGVLLDAKTGW